MPASPASIVYFGDLSVDLRTGELRKNGKRIRLQAQPFQVLTLLLREPGELVTREELRKKLWSDNTFVDFEDGLNTAIRKLRQVLGDSSEHPKFIETLPRRGYRFVASVRDASPQPLPSSPPPDTPTAVAAQSDGHSAPAQLTEPIINLRGGHARWSWAAMAVIALIAGATILSLRASRSGRGAGAPSFPMVRINAPDPLYGVVSADGKYLAYVSHLSDGRESLWFRAMVSAGAGVEIVPSRAVRYWGVTISPDNLHVYYVYQESGAGLGILCRIDALGGVPQRLLEGVDAAVAFEPGGRRMIFKRYFRDNRGEGAALVVARLDGTEARSITETKADYPFYAYDWTADGTIIYAQGVRDGVQTSWYIMEVSANGGSPRRIVGPLAAPVRAVQSLNARETATIVDDAESGLGQIRLFGPRGEVRRITNDPNQYVVISAATDAHRILATESETEDTLWVASVDQRGLERANPPLRPQMITLPSGSYDWPTWTPDGNIVYVGTPSGRSRELWWTTADAKQTRQLTSGGGYKRSPAVALDGRFIVYSSNQNGLLNIWRVEIDGTKASQLTFGGSDDKPQISPTGKWIIYVSHAGGAWGLWKVPSDGGAASRIVDSVETEPAISPDEKFLAFEHVSPLDRRQRWAIVSFDTGALQKEIDLPVDVTKVAWSHNARSLIFLAWQDGEPESLWAQPISGGLPAKLGDLGITDVPASLWSSDGRRVVYLRRKLNVHLVLITGLP